MPGPHLLAVALAVGQEAAQDDGRGPGAGEPAGDKQREAGEEVRQRRRVRLAAGQARHLQLNLRTDCGMSTCVRTG